MAAHPQFSAEYPPIVETWQDTQRIWISAVEPGETRWYLTSVVRVREVWFGLIEIGLAFEGSCDSDLFEDTTS